MRVRRPAAVTTQIAEILNSADIEGLIQIGCPQDEYAPEAEAIPDMLYPEHRSVEAIQSIVQSVWRDMFDLSEEEMAHRRPAFMAASTMIATLLKENHA